MAWTELQATELAVLWKRGRTMGQIAAELKISRSKVSGKLNRLGLLGHMPDFERARRCMQVLMPADVRAIRSLPPGRLKRGQLRELARKYGVSGTTIHLTRIGLRHKHVRSAAA